MSKEFPTFEKHEQASCFNCHGDLDGSYPFKSGYAERCGAWFQCCERCGMKTWYDIAAR